MRSAIAAIALLGVTAAPAGAETLDAPVWYDKAAALVHSLLGEPAPPDLEIIAPRSGIDAQMAVAPRLPRGEMRIIRPPSHPAQQ
jgi:hypothetical protein